jgi:hypothetical protein
MQTSPSIWSFKDNKCQPVNTSTNVPLTLEEHDRLAREDMLIVDAMDLDNDDVSVDASLAMYDDARDYWTDDEDEDACPAAGAI